MRVQINPKPKGAWRKWMAADEDAYTYSLRYRDSRGVECDQHWSHTPNIRPDEHEVKNALVRLERRIIEEGGSFDKAESA